MSSLAAFPAHLSSVPGSQSGESKRSGNSLPEPRMNHDADRDRISGAAMDWIKIMCDFLDHRKIKMIRKGPEGNTLVLLWLLMLTEAGKCNRGGYLMVSDSLPYTAETLSMVTRHTAPYRPTGTRNPCRPGHDRPAGRRDLHKELGKVPE